MAVVLQWYSGTLFVYTFLVALFYFLNFLDEKDASEMPEQSPHLLTDIMQILGGIQGVIDFGLWMIYNHKEASWAALFSWSDVFLVMEEDDKQTEDHWQMYVKDLRRAIIVYATKVRACPPPRGWCSCLTPPLVLRESPGQSPRR
jgi:hypothetical protein